MVVHGKMGVRPLNKGRELIFGLNIDDERQIRLRPLNLGIAISSY